MMASKLHRTFSNLQGIIKQGWKTTKRFLILIKVLVSIIFLYLVSEKVEWEIFLDTDFTVDQEHLLLSVSLILLTFYFNAIRWQAILSYYRVQIPLNLLAEWFIKSNLWGQILPGGGIGGDPFRVIALNNVILQIGISVRSVVIDRSFGLAINLYFSILILCVAARSALNLQSPLYPIIAITLIVAAILGVVVLFNKSRHLGKAVMYSAVIFMIICSAFFLCSFVISTNISFQICLMLFCIVNIAKTFPVSFSGWGIREYTALSVAPFLGIDPAAAVFISVCYGSAVLIAAVVGVLWILAANLFKLQKAL